VGTFYISRFWLGQVGSWQIVGVLYLGWGNHTIYISSAVDGDPDGNCWGVVSRVVCPYNICPFCSWWRASMSWSVLVRSLQKATVTLGQSKNM
jgi:hypothetical protein